MNRLFGSKKQEEKQKDNQQNKKEEKEEEKQEELKEKQYDLSEQQQKIQEKCQSLMDTVNSLEKEISDLYAKLKNSKGSQQATYKQRVIMLLKKKKMYENQLAQFMNQQYTIDQIAFTKENIQNTIEMGQAMKQQIQFQKDMMKDIDIDQLEDLRDEMEEMKEESDYINEMMNRDYAINVDEDELDNELEELDNQMFQQMLQNQKNNVQPQYLSQIQNKQVNQNMF